MKRRSGAFLWLCAVIVCATPLLAGTVGKLVPVRGHLADIDYDWRRELVYAANYTANRIEVYSLATQKLLAPIQVAEQPVALGLSGDQRFLVVGHGNGVITISDLDANERRVITQPEPVLAVGFGSAQQGLIVTPTKIHLLDPLTGLLTQLSVNSAGFEEIPIKPGVFPLNIKKASIGVSGDRETVHILAEAGPGSGIEGEGVIMLRYSVSTQDLQLVGVTTSPELGPRLVSVDQYGSEVMAGWARVSFDPRFLLRAQVANQSGRLDAGTIGYDWRRNLIYMQAELSPDDGTPTPNQAAVLHILDTDNLTIRERIQLPRFLGGRSVFTPDLGMMFSISDSGFMVFSLDQLHQAPRLMPSEESLFFQSDGAICGGRVTKQVFQVTNPNGSAVDFKITLPADARGIRVSPMSGTTPATITVEVDLTAYQYQKGTVSVPLTLTSKAAVNVPPQVKLLLNARELEQRGQVVKVAGRLVDVASDPFRGRFYVLRQDKNLVLVFNANTLEQIGTMRTGNTPVQMAITGDGRYMIVTNDNSQLANVFDLDTLEATEPIEFPLGRYPRSIAVTARSIWATARLVGQNDNLCKFSPGGGGGGGTGAGEVLRVDLGSRVATSPQRLGVYCNTIDQGAVISSSPTGLTAMLVEPTGSIMVYEAETDTWVVGRKDFDSLDGAYSALDDSLYLVNNYILDQALVPILEFDPTAGTPSGAVTIPGSSFIRTTASPDGFGYLERLDMVAFPSSRNSRLTEAPLSSADPVPAPVGLEGVTVLPLTRTLAYVPSPERLVSLSTSGVQILPLNFDAVVTVPPVVSGVTNPADMRVSVAPGGLITIRGSMLSGRSETAGAKLWPTILGDACVLVNGTPIPLGRVSPTEIVGQVPFTVAGAGSLIVQTAGGKSSAFAIPLFTAAPAIFRDGAAGPVSGIAAIFRKQNNELVTASNPVRPEDDLVIFLTGMGAVSPALDAGIAAPAEPVFSVVSQPQVNLGSTALEVRSSVVEPGRIGVYRLEVKVPWKLSQTGWEVPLSIEQAGYATSLAVRVVGN